MIYELGAIELQRTLVLLQVGLIANVKLCFYKCTLCKYLTKVQYMYVCCRVLTSTQVLIHSHY